MPVETSESVISESVIDDSGGDDSRDPIQRRHRRYLLSLPVTLERFPASGPVLTRGRSLDISKGGMTALVCGPPQLGETVLVTLQLPDTPLQSFAIVRHSNSTGSGLEFVDLSLELDQWIEDYCAQEFPAAQAPRFWELRIPGLSHRATHTPDKTPGPKRRRLAK